MTSSLSIRHLLGLQGVSEKDIRAILDTAVEFRQAVCVTRKMCRNPIQNNANPFLMHIIHKIHKIARRGRNA